MESKEQFNPEDLERIKNFRYIDDDFMTACFDGNIEAVELVLRIVMGKDDLEVKSLQVQKVMKNLQGRSAVLDAHAIDRTKKEYDIEIQRADAGAGAKRARHNSSLLDAHILKPGEEPEDMPESYVIFITQNDVMKNGRAVYRIDRYIDMDDEKVLFGDGSHILYVNGEYRGDDDMGKLMHDFSCVNPDDMNYEELARKARYFKRDEKGVAAMCKMMEDMRNEAAQAAVRSKAREKAMLMYKDGKLTLTEIPIYFQELSKEDIKEIELTVKPVLQQA
ncbi:MAG: hypothetical protein NC541_14655 [bacterium]|nr:hypothetical protein [bacterium]